MKKTLLGIVLGCLVSNAWAYTVSDYSQDGLLHQWDAIANVNAYTHDANATVWKDLAGDLDDVGPIDLYLTENGSWGDNWLEVDGCSATGLVASAEAATMEVVYRMTAVPGDTTVKTVVFSRGSNTLMFHFSNDGTRFLSQANGSWQKYVTTTFNAEADHCLTMMPAADFYLDGVKKGTGNVPSNYSLSQSPSVVMMGASTAAGGNPWTGRIYAVRLYARKLTVDEINRHQMIDNARFFSKYPAKSIGVTANDERFGSPVPGYGALSGLTVGESYDFTAEQFSTNVAGTAAAECAGWEVYHGAAETPFRTSNDGGEDPFSCTVEFTGDEIVRWIWRDRSYLVRATGLHATPDVAEAWVRHGEGLTITATPEVGYEVACWDGDAAAAGATLAIDSVEDALAARVCGVRPAPADAERVVYVSPAGSDEGDGSSWEQAFGSPESAVAALEGTTELSYVLVAPGLYRTKAVMALSAPIRVIGSGADETVLDGGRAGFRCATVSHDLASVSDLTLRRYQRKGNAGGVSVSKGEVRRCVIRDCRTMGEESSGWDSGHGSGAAVSGTGLLADCEVTACTTEKSHGKGNALWISGGVVTNCDIHANNNGYAHSSMTEGAGGVYMTGGQLLASKVHDNYRNSVGGIWMNNANAKVVNCLVYGNTATANGAGVYQSNGQLVNCTVYGNVLTADASGYSGVRLLSGSAQNNIIWGNGPVGTPGGSCSVASGKTFDHNVIDVAIAAYPNNYMSDPKFVDAAAGDFRISSRSSDAYANGDASVAPATDITGAVRDAENPDIGAYAYDASIETYGVSLKMAADFPLGSNVVAEAVVSGAADSECTFAWTLDGMTLAGKTEKIVDLAGLSAGRHVIGVTIDSARGEASASAMCAVKPYAVFVNTTGSGTFPYDTAAKGTNSLEEAYAALWRDAAHTSEVTVAAGTYRLTGQILMKAPVRVAGAGRDETVFVKAFKDGRCFLLGDDGAQVTGLTVRDGTSGAAFSVDGGRLASCAVRNFNVRTTLAGVGASLSRGLIEDCWFIGVTNESDHACGGGLYMEAGVVSNCLVRACASDGWDSEPYGGGGLYMRGGRLVDCRFESCGYRSSHRQPGSAIRLDSNSAVIDRCVFANNYGEGDIVCYFRSANDSGTRPVVRNSLICGNSGGRIIDSGRMVLASQKKPFSVDFVNVTVASNSSTEKGYVFGGTIRNSILDDTLSYEIAEAVVVSNSCCAVLTDGENGNVTGDPCFKRPASGNFRLRAVSPCLNTGDPSPFADDPEATDLDGNPRVYRDKIHMGCYQNLNLGLMLMVR